MSTSSRCIKALLLFFLFSYSCSSAGGSPANLLAVPQEDNNISVTWDALGSPVTGYIVYYQPDGGAVSSRMVDGGNSNTVMLVGLSLMSNISIVALTSHLPGPVVRPTGKCFSRYPHLMNSLKLCKYYGE